MPKYVCGSALTSSAKQALGLEPAKSLQKTKEKKLIAKKTLMVEMGGIEPPYKKNLHYRLHL